MLRSYGTLFESYTKIQESIIAKRTQLSTEEIKVRLNKLNDLEVINYIPQNSHPKLIFLKERLDVKQLNLSKESVEKRRSIEIKKANSIINYVKNQHQCRSSLLIDYFGEKNHSNCGKCDICLQRKKLNISNIEFEKISNGIQKLLSDNALTIDDIVMQLVDYREDKIIEVLQFLSDNRQIAFNTEKKLYWLS